MPARSGFRVTATQRDHRIYVFEVAARRGRDAMLVIANRPPTGDRWSSTKPARQSAMKWRSRAERPSAAGVGKTFESLKLMASACVRNYALERPRV